MALNGYIKLHRKLIEWEWYSDRKVKEVFIHLLLLVSFKDGNWRGQGIKRGQFVTSYKTLSKDLGYTLQELRTVFKKLKSTNEVNTVATGRNLLVTLVNFDSYQSEEKDEQHDSNTITTGLQHDNNTEATSKQQHRKNVKKDKKVNNVKNVNKESKETPSQIELLKSELEKKETEILELKNKEKKDLPKSSAKKVSKVPPTENELNYKNNYKPYYFDFLRPYKFDGWSKELVNYFYLYCEAREKKEKEKNPRYSFNDSGIKDSIRQIESSRLQYGDNITEIAVQEATPTPWVNLQPEKVKNRLEREKVKESTQKNDDGTPSFMMGLQ